MIDSEILSIIDTSKKEQRLIVPIFEYLHTVLVKYNIDYIVAYGTLLGTVLYNNFIPWDDDIDLILDNKNISSLKKYLSNRYQIIESDQNLCFFYDTVNSRKIDIFVAKNNSFNGIYNLNNFQYSKLDNLIVKIPKNYKFILDLTYGDDWNRTAYITNHCWSRSKLNSEMAFDKQYKDQYHKIPISTIKQYLSENKIKVDRPV